MTSEDTFAGPRGNGVVFYFHCDDADDVYHRLVERGVAVEPPTVAFYGMKQVFVTDPDGYQLCFQNPVDPEPSDCVVSDWQGEPGGVSPRFTPRPTTVP